LDEPTAALDVASQAALAGLMRAHLAGGGLVIAATHQALGLEKTRDLSVEAFRTGRSEAAADPFSEVM
ncbi:cytochrome C biogenesis protein CcmA, partial [Methylobacterium indicum]